MKKNLLVGLLFSLSFCQLSAQAWVYHPFPTDSAIWTNANGWWNVNTTSSPPTATLIMLAPTRYCMTASDTIIGTDTY